MKHRWSENNTLTLEKNIAFDFTMCVFTIIFNLSFPTEKLLIMQGNIGFFLVILSIFILKLLFPIVSIFTGYNAILLSLQYIRQALKKGGK